MDLKKLGILMVLGIFLFALGCENTENPTSSSAPEDLPLVRVAKSVPADADIDSAKIFIYVPATDTQTVTVHAVTSDWDESSVTWNNFAAAFSSDTIGTFDFEEPGWYTLDVTGQVEGWFDESIENFGFLLQYGGEDSAMTNISSSEADENNPYLEICYTIHEGDTCEEAETEGDATIFSAEPEGNYGEAVNFMVGGLPDVDSTYGALIRFDFSVEIRFVSIGDMVFHDADNDGVFDEGEVGIEGIKVYLYDCDENLLDSTMTDAEGTYLFDSLMAGDYVVEFEPPENYIFSTPDGGKTECMNILPGVDNLDVDAGLFPEMVTIGDLVWNDSDKDGMQDDGEPGMEGIKVYLYDCEDNLLDSTMTDAGGMYLFDSLMAGDYVVWFEAPENFVFSTPETGMTECLTLAPGDEYLDADAGLYLEPAMIGDYIWNDANMNGIQDEDESGMEGIKVYLYDCMDNLLDSTMSDPEGMYMFNEVDEGSYYLEFVNPFGYVFTYQDMGGDDAIDSDVDRYQKTTECFSVGWGDDATHWDAGLFAYEGCTYGKGYWKNHAGFGPQDDEISIMLPIWLGEDDGSKSIAVTDAQIAYDILTQHVYGHPSNGITKLYAHFLTAKLNIFNFANPEDINGLVDEVDAFLANYDWNDWNMLDKDQKKMVLQWKGHFEEYNEGYIGPGHCGEDDGDDDDDDDDNGRHRPGYLSF